MVNESLSSIWIDGVENVVEEHLVYSAAFRDLPRKELGHSWELECLLILVLHSQLIIVRYLNEPDVVDLFEGA